MDRGRCSLGESKAVSDPRPAGAGELYDLDASSLQLKVLQYVSPYVPPPPVLLQDQLSLERSISGQIPTSRPFSLFHPPEDPQKARGWEWGWSRSPVSAPPPVPPFQLQQETHASRCCLLLVSEDNLQLSCKVRAQVPGGTGRGTSVSEEKNLVYPLTGLLLSVPQVIGDKVLEEDVSFPVSLHCPLCWSLQEQLRQTRCTWDLHRATGIC